MKWLKIEVHADESMEEILTAVFLDVGAQGVNVEGDVREPLQPGEYLDEYTVASDDFCVSAYFAMDGTQKTVLQTIKNRLIELNVQEQGRFSYEIKTQELDEQDWANAWKAYFKPLKAGNYVVIKPTWEEYLPQKDELVIELDPGMAFGTGTHESTRMCIQLLEEFVEKDSVVVDVGTGSGILSVAAALLGAGRVYAMDFDQVAVEAARENVALNHCEDKVTVMKSNLLDAVGDDVKANVMVANIIADVVIQLADKAAKNLSKSGMLICSGIIDTRLGDVKQALEHNGFKTIKVLQDGEWRAIACKYRV